MMYVLTSSLLKPSSSEEVLAVQFTDDWSSLHPTGEVGFRRATLPGYNTGSHRIVVVEGSQVSRRSIYVTGTLSDSVTRFYNFDGNF